jgi:hypothetical protein
MNGKKKLLLSKMMKIFTQQMKEDFLKLLVKFLENFTQEEVEMTKWLWTFVFGKKFEIF